MHGMLHHRELETVRGKWVTFDKYTNVVYLFCVSGGVQKYTSFFIIIIKWNIQNTLFWLINKDQFVEKHVYFPYCKILKK